jgi:hypothetical protein
MSCHFSFFLYFTRSYISLIYDVFLNKALQVFDDDEKDIFLKNMKTII